MEKLNRRNLLLGCGATLMCNWGACASGAIDEQGFTHSNRFLAAMRQHVLPLVR